MIGFAGLSHLGIVSSVATASKGFQVTAFDPDGQLCSDLTQGRPPIAEPGLEELLKSSANQIEFTSDAASLGQCSVVYVSLDVTTDDDGNSDQSPLNGLIDQVIAQLATESTLVILSQVPPGFNRRLAKSLEDRRPGSGISLYHQVETLIFGRAVERALEPERIIIGCARPDAGLPSEYLKLLESFGCPLLPMGYESAELTKAAINICLVSSISAANTLAEICEAIGADWSEVVPALRSDRRIGQYAYLTPGLGLSGGNLERDLATIVSIAAEHGTDSSVIGAYLENSRHRQTWALRTLWSQVLAGRDDPTIGIWGLAYKQDTDSIKNSPALVLINSLGGSTIRAYDPQATLNGGAHNTVQVATALDVCRGADALAIMTPWPEFSQVNLAQVREAMSGKVIVDPFGVLDRQQCDDLGFRHFQLGRATTC